MGATFKQDQIDLRAEINALQSAMARIAQNEEALLPVKAYAGKNLLINGDKSISQRGDYTTATDMIGGVPEFFLDRYSSYLDLSSGTLQHIVTTEGNSLKIVSTGIGAGLFNHSQRIENYEALIGKTVTYTATVKSNRATTLKCQTNISSVESSHISGDGEWETLSLTYIVPEGLTHFYAIITTESDSAVYAGDYFEIRNEQLEIGSEFTEYEIVDPATQLTKCRRYFRISESTGQAAEFSHDMRTSPVETGAGPYNYDAEL